MPLEIIEMGEKRAWAIWRITEMEEELTSFLTINEEIPGSITNQSKRLEWMAGRVLTQTLLASFDTPYRGIVKDEHGKPFPAARDFELSLTHSFPYVAAIVDKSTSVGIDLEQPKEKLLRIAPRILATEELADAGDDVVKHCVYWCAKETLIKIHGRKDLTLSKNLALKPFDLEQEGHLVGKIIVGSEERVVPLYYRVYKKFVLVFNTGTEPKNLTP